MNLYLQNTGLNLNLKLSLLDAFLISLIAVSIIIVLLIAIMFIVYLLKYSLDGFDKTSSKLKSKIAKFLKREKTQEVHSEERGEAAQLEALGTYGQVKLHDVKEKDAAMIMAIVANKLDMPINKLRFISIREIGTVEEEE